MPKISLSLAFAAFLLAVAVGGALAQFDLNPSSPLPLAQSGVAGGFDVQVHSRDSSTWGDSALDSMQAQHGADCSGPPSTHENHTYAGAVFICNNHVMTAMNAGGYGMIALTPGQLLNCSQGCTVQWDMSTERSSLRDWPDVWLTPWSDNLTLPFDAGDVDLQGVPRRGIHLSAAASQSSWSVSTIANSSESALSNAWWVSMGSDIAAGTNQAAIRQTFKLTITPGHVRFERLASATATNIVWVDAACSCLLAPDYVVQFAQHSYNPAKDGAGAPATWHWDEFKVSPSVPFTIIKTHTRALFQNGSIVFDAPAPTNSWLRFSAVGSVQYSVNGGSTYQTAPKQSFISHPEHAASYFVPIPAGTQSVSLKLGADSWYQGPFVAQDFAIWSKGGTTPPPPPPPTATTVPPTQVPPTQIPPTKTPVPPTQTPIPSTQTPASWTTSATVAKTTVARGATENLTVSVTANKAANAVVDMEIYDSAGTKVWQSYRQNVTFAAGVSQTIQDSWTVPSTSQVGTYTVKIGVFSPGCGQILSWNNSAVRFIVN